MISKEQIVHDLAMLYAKEEYRKSVGNIPVSNSDFMQKAGKLCQLYEQGAAIAVSRINDLYGVYLDEDGKPIL